MPCLKLDHLETLQKIFLHSSSFIDIPELDSGCPSIVGSLAHPGTSHGGQRPVELSVMAT